MPDAAPDVLDRLKSIRSDMRTEYLASHSRPWVVGYSGGKDSTLLLHLVLETLLQLPPDLRTRPVFVLSNDTRVESPVFQDSVNASLDRVRDGVDALGLPVTVVQTHPEDDSSFWVNLLGRGYPAPNRNFRWCTDRMKIRPTTKFIREKVDEAGEVILLLGVRRAESAARSGRINAYNEKAKNTPNERLNPHNDIKGCLIYRPIVELADNDVWVALLAQRPPWGGSHRELVTLYRNAKGGECPFVMTKDDAPSCGSNSARFGCWTCTVVEKDNSINGLIDSGFEHLEPLAAFRERLKEASANPECRSKIRRNGQPGLGPLTIDTRRVLLEELLDVQRETGMSLISQHEVRLIRDWWNRDETEVVVREMDRLIQLTVGDAVP